ncbi:MAG: hypothetical protein KatS3mg105_2452 [Gemmatales bacterium]|nr:MAG: hypothetical protein KatS3mg105_2452 [Gemmatales bacterium]
MMSILHRKILAELIKIFSLSLLGITGILVMAGIVAEASQQGLQPAQILVAIPLLVPSTLPYTIPTTTLFATCLVYGRLAHDNEILAIRAAGINVLYVVWPGIMLGLLASSATMGMYYHLIPETHYMLRTRFLNEVEEYMYAILRKDRCIKQPGFHYAMWVRQVQGRRLVDALFKRQDEKGNYDIIAHAKEAYLHVDMAKEEVVVRMRHGEVYGGGDSRGYFEERSWSVPLPEAFTAKRHRRPRAMTWQQLFSAKEELMQEIQKRAAEIAVQQARLMMHNAPFDLPQHIENLKTAQKYRQRDLNALLTEIHMRPALSFGCLFFVIVGCPVGIWFSRSDYLSAFITCFLPICFLYYPLMLCSTNLSKDGSLPPAVAMWLANGLLALIAPILFWQLLKN